MNSFTNNVAALRVLLSIIFIAMIALPASALTISKYVYVDASPAVVWSVLRPECSMIEWYPGIDNCETYKKNDVIFRKYHRDNGDTFIDKAITIDCKNMILIHEIIETSLPVSNFESKLQIISEGNQSKLIWSGKFYARGVTEVQAKLAVGGRFDVGLHAIVRKLDEFRK